jgi:uncharacterized protein YndB with AHSA1/START domain
MNDTAPPPRTPARSLDETTVRIERLLPGPIERLWRYLTEGELRGTWFAAGEFDLRPGGAVSLVFDHANLSHEKEPPPKYAAESKAVMQGTITRIDAPRLLAYSWRMGEEDSEVTFELAPRGNQVLLVVTHRRLDTRELKVSVAAGWDAHLAILEDRLAERAPRGFWSLHGQLEKSYEASL